MIEFSYRKEYSPVLGEIHRPSAEVILKHNDKIVLFYPYIDSGADITLIPRSLGEMLGLELNDNIIELGGLGDNKVPVLIKKIEIKIGRYIIPLHVAWALIEEIPPLLGRKDLFTLFLISFDEENKVIQFKAKPNLERYAQR